MALFSYRALTAEGEAVTGEIEAADARSAVARLQEGGLIPIAAEPASARSGGGSLLGSRGLKKAVTEFTREFATLLGAGQTVEGALAMLVDASEHRRLQRSLAEVLDAVRGGKALSEAMAADPAAFPRLYVSMIRAGEASGRLEQVAAELAVLRERAEALQRRLTSAMIYPAVLLLASLGSLAILLTVVVPKFAPLFANAGEALPGSTRLVLAAADLIGEQGVLILAGLLALLLGLRLVLARPALRALLDRWLLNAPLLGRLSRERVTAQAMRGLATLLAGGLDLPQALAMVRDMIANQAARDAFFEVVDGVRQGRTLSACLAEADVLAPLALKMLRVGEESGRLGAVAAHLADSFEERVATRLTRLVAVIEPAMVIFLGLLVGGIVTSILTAVVSVNDLAF